ncbi:MAG: hypothetical protein H0V01_13740 [Bacteroidetes bacterium]|nr:hypothetical protein [Bacteroidota bacterium]HET6245417.1 hypothetical protein [Bacteroidia bacterium]
MFLKHLSLFVCFWLFSLFINSISAQTGVNIHIIPAIHGLHQKNVNYNYDSLYSEIKKINPDFIIVEIRQEDMGQDTSYLKKNYPGEMWIMRYWFSNKKHFGMDWLGKDLQDKPIPDNYWAEKSDLKKWEKELDKDSSLTTKLQACEEIQFMRIPTLTEGSFLDITNGEDEKLTLQYYQCLDRVLTNTKHSRITEFYQLRNYTMAERIAEVVKKNGEGNYVVLTGVDHIPFIKIYLFKMGLGSAIKT